MRDFEECVASLTNKLQNDEYAKEAYRSLCNTEWVSKDAPPDWYDYLEQKNKDWERKNNIWWRKLSKELIHKFRKIIIRLAYGNGNKRNKFFSYINHKLLNLEYLLWVMPDKQPGWIYNCSWRHAGGLIADIRNKGEDYMRFYLSGNEGDIDTDFVDDMITLGWIPIGE